jgi:hypothetical protein
MEESILREKVRQKLQEEKLPSRPPDRLWGGPGVNAPCAVCDQPVSKSEMEFEVQFKQDGKAPSPAFDVFHAHTRCYAVWELVRSDGKGP